MKIKTKAKRTHEASSGSSRRGEWEVWDYNRQPIWKWKKVRQQQRWRKKKCARPRLLYVYGFRCWYYHYNSGCLSHWVCMCTVCSRLHCQRMSKHVSSHIVFREHFINANRARPQVHSQEMTLRVRVYRISFETFLWFVEDLWMCVRPNPHPSEPICLPVS